MTSKADLTYSCTDGIWTRFYPNTAAGTEAWGVMAAADTDGVVAFSQLQVPDVLRQLKAAGLTVRKANPHKPASDAEIDALLAELDQA
jgi:hypothetical protein